MAANLSPESTASHVRASTALGRRARGASLKDRPSAARKSRAPRDRGRASRPLSWARPPGPRRGSRPRRRALDLGLAENEWPKVGAGAKNWSRKHCRLTPRTRSARPMDQPQKNGWARARAGLAAPREAGVRLRPRREFAVARLARTPRNEARHMGPMGPRLRGPRLSLPPAGLRIGAHPNPAISRPESASGVPPLSRAACSPALGGGANGPRIRE